MGGSKRKNDIRKKYTEYTVQEGGENTMILYFTKSYYGEMNKSTHLLSSISSSS